MAFQNCEVIGCPRPAEWQHTLPAGSNAEQYLCCHHWSYLRACTPAKVMFYIPLCVDAEGEPQNTSRV